MKKLILLALMLPAFANAESYQMMSAKAQTCGAVAGVAVKAAAARVDDTLTWEGVLNAFSNIKPGAYRSILLDTVQRAYDVDYAMPPGMLRSFSYDRCLTLMQQHGY